MSANNIGTKFELYIARLYKDLEKSNVRHNKVIKVPKKKLRVQIDIIYSSWLIDHYVECKYKKSSKVSLEDVAKFYAVLELIKVPAKRGEIITNSYFNARAAEYADSKGIKLYNLDDLKKMELRRQSLWSKLFGSEVNIMKAINETK